MSKGRHGRPGGMHAALHPAVDPAAHPFSGVDLTTLLEAQAKRRNDHPLLIWAPFDAPVEKWSYARFAEESARLAGGLAGRGVRCGDRVMVHLENCPEMLLARFACARIGAICVATNALAAGSELSWFAELSGARCAITQPKFAAIVARHCPGLEWIAVTDTDAGAPAAKPEHASSVASLRGEPPPARKADPALPASIMFTTGTTSRPKAVLWSHANALWGGRLGAMQHGVRQDDVHHLVLPLFHVIGFAWSFMPALWAGATVLLQPRFSMSRYWPAALEHRATMGAQVNSTMRRLAQHEVPDHHFRQWSAGVWTPELEAKLRLRIVGGWGMTELISQGIIGDPALPQTPGSIGRPSAGYDARIVDAQGRDIAPGGTGHLLVRGVRGLSVFSEYFRDEKATAEAFDDAGYFLTGDLVRLNFDGTITFADRLKDVIKVGGEGVSAAEIEAAIMAVAGVREAAVVARPDADLGEVPAAFVLLGPSAMPGIEARILEHCRRTLARFKVPREVFVIEGDFPRIGNEKIHKARLREMARESRV